MLEDVVERLQKLAIWHTLEAPEPTKGQHHSLGELLGTCLESHDKQTAFLMAYVNHEGLAEDFWEKILPQHPEFQQGHIVEKIRFTVQCANLHTIMFLS